MLKSSFAARTRFFGTHFSRNLRMARKVFAYRPSALLVEQEGKYAIERFCRNVHTIKAGFLMTLLCANIALATELADLPIGHLEITTNAEGEINVEARCVPTKDLIEAICAKGNIHAIFETSCTTYESVWKPETYKMPKDWLNFYGIICTVEERTCRVRSWGAADDDYGPGMTEEQLRMEHLPVVAAETPREGIATGGLVFQGQPILGPYAVSYKVNPDKGADIIVNGVTIETIPPIATPMARQVPMLPSSGQFPDIGSLFAYISESLYPQELKKGLTPKEAMQRVVDFLKGQELVAEIALDERSGPRISTKQDKNPQWPSWFVFPGGYDLTTGINQPPPFQRVDLQEEAKYAKESWESRLARREIFFFRPGCLLSLDRNGIEALSNRLKTAKALSMLQTECLLSEILLDRVQARWVAIRFKSDGERIMSALSAIAETNK